MKMKLTTIVVCALIAGRVSASESGPTRSVIVLNGASRGGILTLMPAPGGNYAYVAVTNTIGDAASSVIHRLASELSKYQECIKQGGGRPYIALRENALVLLGGGARGPSWIFGGSETGFNIPPPPTALSALCQSNQVTLEWINPSNAYDSISVVYNGIPWAKLDGSVNRFVYERLPKRDPFPWGSGSFFILGCKDGTPSNGAGIGLRNQTCQESLMNVPFTGSVAPSFVSWAHVAPNGVKFEQGNLPGMSPGAEVREFFGKGFYQIVRGTGSFSGGVARRFIGLSPGHSYRVGARLNTLETTSTNNWAFSFHAAYDSSSSLPISAEQMAGSMALPDGSKGESAGLIAKYWSDETTTGVWTNRFSTAKESGRPGTDVTLPKQGADSITVWFRITGNNATNIVAGIDSLTLEDLGVVDKTGSVRNGA